MLLHVTLLEKHTPAPREREPHAGRAGGSWRCALSGPITSGDRDRDNVTQAGPQWQGGRLTPKARPPVGTTPAPLDGPGTLPAGARGRQRQGARTSGACAGLRDPGAERTGTPPFILLRWPQRGWLAREGRAGRNHAAAQTEQPLRAEPPCGRAHTHNEVASYLDEVWKMARL